MHPEPEQSQKGQSLRADQDENTATFWNEAAQNLLNRKLNENINTSKYIKFYNLSVLHFISSQL